MPEYIVEEIVVKAWGGKIVSVSELKHEDIVRCRDCGSWDMSDPDEPLVCKWNEDNDPNGFCAWGEKR